MQQESSLDECKLGRNLLTIAQTWGNFSSLVHWSITLCKCRCTFSQHSVPVRQTISIYVHRTRLNDKIAPLSSLRSKQKFVNMSNVCIGSAYQVVQFACIGSTNWFVHCLHWLYKLGRPMPTLVLSCTMPAFTLKIRLNFNIDLYKLSLSIKHILLCQESN